MSDPEADPEVRRAHALLGDRLGAGARYVLVAEHWAKAATWPARAVGVPLLVGADPGNFRALLEADDVLARAEECLWQALARDGELRAGEAIPPARLRAVAQRLGCEPPDALIRLLDFIAAVMPAAGPAPAGAQAPAPALQRAQDEAAMLGAALAQLTRTPAACVDETGCFDAERIAGLVFRQAAVWFPLAPPSLSRDETVRLIARWLPRAPSQA